MDIGLLGPVTLTSDRGESLPLGGAKQRAVLALLALHAGRVVSLDRLIEEMWPTGAPEQSTLGIQSYVSRLRRLLAQAADGTDHDEESADPGRPDGHATPPADHRPTTPIRTRAPGWRLEVPPECIDAIRFTELADSAARMVRDGAYPEALTGATTALGLWRGPALADLAAEQFARPETQRLEELRAGTHETCLDAQLALGLSGEAAVAAAALVVHYPYRERFWATLMLALYRCGRQAEALDAYARARQLLDTELGLQPGPELQRLHERILRQDDGLQEPVLETMALAPRLLNPGRPPEPLPAALVGREEVLTRLAQSMAALKAGTGGTVVITGAAGMGKSALLDELRTRALASGALVASASGIESAAPSLWPWITVLRQLASTGRMQLGSSAADHLVRTLDPGLDGRDAAPPGDAAPTGDPVLGRTRLFRAYVDLLHAAASEQPLVILLDNVHRVDADSLQLLALAADGVGSWPLLIVLAAQPMIADLPQWPAVLEQLRRQPLVELELTGLSADDVAALTFQLTGDPCPLRLAAALQDRTEGNPLFVRELVQLLKSERGLDESGVAAALPDGVRDVLQRRLRRLPPQTLSVLTVGSALGRRIEIGVLERVTGLDTDAVLDACESALAVGLLTDDPADPSVFVMSHDLVRDTLYRSLSTPRRVRLHAAAAAALQHAEPIAGDQLSELIRHLVAAVPAVSASAVVPYLIRSADEALTRYAFEQAESDLREALTRGRSVPAPATDLLTSLSLAQVRLRVLLSMTRGFASAETTELLLLDVAELGEEALRNDDGLALWFTRHVAALCRCEFHSVDTDARELLARSDRPAARGAAGLLAGIAALSVGDQLQAAADFAGAADDLARGGPSGPLEAFHLRSVATSSMGLAAHLGGDDERAAEFCATGVRLASEAGSMFGSAVSHYFSAWVAASADDPATARLHAAAVADMDKRYGFPQYAAFCRVFDGWARARQGDRAGASLTDSAHTDLLATGTIQGSSVVLALRAEAHLRAGDRDRAGQLAAGSAEHSRVTGEDLLGPRLGELMRTLTARRQSTLGAPRAGDRGAMRPHS